MKISTMIMTTLVGGMCGLFLREPIGLVPTLIVAFALGSLISYLNETYTINIKKTRA